MKSRQTCFDPAIGRTALRRFAPVWMLYSMAVLLLTMFIIPSDKSYTYMYNMEGYIQIMTAVNFAYAFVLAQLLFGDLYTPRLCYAIHAMPITRGGFFSTQIALGILGSLIPNAVNAGIMLLMVHEFRITVLWWLITSQCQFLFFFGAAALCALCAGNRIGMTLLDGILNFFAFLLFWFQQNLFEPMLYGIHLRYTSNYKILQLCPAYQMIANNVFDFKAKRVSLVRGGFDVVPNEVFLTPYFWVNLVYAAIGIGFMVVAMKCYRKRKLECAGDLLAFPKLKPFFLLLFTLTAGGFGHVMGFAVGHKYTIPMLFLGLVLGYYAGSMFLKRQVNIWKETKIAPIGIICGVFFLAIVLINQDVFGIATKTVDRSKVVSAALNRYSSTQFEYETTDPEEISKIVALQEISIAEWQERFHAQSFWKQLTDDQSRQSYYIDENGDEIWGGYCTVQFTMADGSTVLREYDYLTNGEAVPIVKYFFSKPEAVFSELLKNTNSDLDTMLQHVPLIHLECDHQEDSYVMGTKYIPISTSEEMTSLVQAVLADCEEETMAQQWNLHDNTASADHLIFFYPFESDESDTFLEDQYKYVAAKDPYASITIFPDCANTQQWLIDHGYHE